MDWKENLIDIVVRDVGYLTALVAIVMFWRTYRTVLKSKGSQGAGSWMKSQISGLFAKQIIWIFLVIECGVFILSWPVFKWTQCTDAAMDYWAFASPCLAGIFAGMAVMNKKASSAAAGVPATASVAVNSRSAVGERLPEPREPRTKKGELGDVATVASVAGSARANKGFTPEYILYIVSLVLLMAGYAAYVWVHFAYSTLAWLIICTGVAMTIGYFVEPTRRWFNHPHGFSEPVSLGIGFALVVMLAALGWFVQAERDVFLGADTKYVRHACDKE
jgi:hypothetical protein